MKAVNKGTGFGDTKPVLKLVVSNEFQEYPQKVTVPVLATLGLIASIMVGGFIYQL